MRVISLALIGFILASSAWAAPVSLCSTDRPEIPGFLTYEDLKKELAIYGETPVYKYNPSGFEWVTEKIMFRNLQSGSWTLVAVESDGRACTLQSGNGFENLSEP